MAGKEETPKCRKKTVTWTNEIIEDLIDFMEIQPIVWNVKDKSYHDKDKKERGDARNSRETGFTWYVYFFRHKLTILKLTH
jgi:hypothetical protein